MSTSVLTRTARHVLGGCLVEHPRGSSTGAGSVRLRVSPDADSESPLYHQKYVAVVRTTPVSSFDLVVLRDVPGGAEVSMVVERAGVLHQWRQEAAPDGKRQYKSVS